MGTESIVIILIKLKNSTDSVYQIISKIKHNTVFKADSGSSPLRFKTMLCGLPVATRGKKV